MLNVSQVGPGGSRNHHSNWHVDSNEKTWLSRPKFIHKHSQPETKNQRGVPDGAEGGRDVCVCFFSRFKAACKEAY